MSEIVTTIRLPMEGVRWAGHLDWGRQTREHMIAEARKAAAHQLEWAERILAAKDEDFVVKVARGSIVQHHIATLVHGVDP